MPVGHQGIKTRHLFPVRLDGLEAEWIFSRLGRERPKLIKPAWISLLAGGEILSWYHFAGGCKWMKQRSNAMGRVSLHWGCTAAARGVPEERNALQIPAIRIPPRSGCPTPEGLMASWIKTEQNQSWCYSILAAHGNHRRSLKKWMPDLASGKHHKLPPVILLCS